MKLSLKLRQFYSEHAVQRVPSKESTQNKVTSKHVANLKR